jgi:VWFA-related protein
VVVGWNLCRLALALVIPVGVASAVAQESETTREALVEEAEAAQEAPPRFEAEVEQVIVDLVVTDRKGNPVPGLTQDDLTITEDGVPQEIVSFEAIRLPEEPMPVAAALPRISKNTGPSAQLGRTFVIVFDDVNLSPQRARDAKAAVASFLTNGVREGDSVAVIATSGDAWWTSRMVSGRDQLIDIVKRLEGQRIPDTSPERLTDWEAMRIHVYQDRQVTQQVMQRFENFGVMMITQADRDNPMTGTEFDPFVTARAHEVYFEARRRNQRTLEVLERTLNGLASAQGRKSVVLVSEGFIYDPGLEEFKRVNVASRRANAAIYFVNARGLQGMPAEFSAAFGPAPASADIGFALSSLSALDDGPEVLADDSGGFTVRNTNDLDSGIQRIARETRNYYLLGYVPSNKARDGAFRKIEVRLKDGKGLKVRARKGYYAPSADGTVAVEAKAGVDPAMQAVLDSPWAEDGIPLRMTHYVLGERMIGNADVVLVTELDVDALEFEEKDGRYASEIEFLLVVAHRESGEYYRYDQTVTMSLRPATRERLSRTWYPIVREFELRPGDHQAKIIVRETATGLIGSVVHEFSVPSLDEFRVSTPILSDTPRPGPPGTGLQPQPLARREFLQGGELVCQFEVYGAAKDETGMPRVAQGYKVLRADGTVYKLLPQTIMNPTSIGSLARLFVLSLDHAEPGQYEMVLSFRDVLSGKTRELHEPFTVVPPSFPTKGTEGSATGRSEPG